MKFGMMKIHRRNQLLLIAVLILGAGSTLALVMQALTENINLFYPPSKIVNGDVPLHTVIRAGGCVVPGSVQRAKTNLDVTFMITDGNAEVEVLYNGILPDLFAEGEAAVVSGKVNERRVIEATQVLAKHDETYMPPEVADAVSNANSGAAEAAEQGKDHQASCEGMNYDS